jgi:hypothetical protein
VFAFKGIVYAAARWESCGGRRHRTINFGTSIAVQPNFMKDRLNALIRLAKLLQVVSGRN